MRAVPGHEEYVLYPYEQDYVASAERCRKMGNRCSADIEVEIPGKTHAGTFWAFLKKHTGGVPGQKESWRGPTQWSAPINSEGDLVGIYVGNENWLWLYIRSSGTPSSKIGGARMRTYSWKILEQMGDQMIEDNVDDASANGRSVSVQKRWERDNEDEWAEAAEWLIDQFERLRAIVSS